MMDMKDVINNIIISNTKPIIMVIYLVRHGETIEGEQNRILGQLGGNLNQKGIQFANDVGIFLKQGEYNIEKIYTSDLKRAIDTTKIITSHLGVPFESYKILEERAAGDVEGKLESEIDWIEYEKMPLIERKHNGGETFTDVEKRAKIFLESLYKTNEKEILVVSHAVFIMMFMKIVLEMDINDVLKFPLNRRIIKVLIKKGEKPDIESITI